MADLRNIALYIARDSRTRARTFIAELRAQAQKIGDAPHGYPLVPLYEASGVRRRPYGNYLLFYRVCDGEVSILHILHAAMDYEAILFPE